MKYFFLALCALFVFEACTKDPVVIKNKENLLRTGKWKISSGSIKQKLPNGTYTSRNYTDILPDCWKDDYIVFDSGVRAALYYGSEKCNAGEGEYTSFTWQLTNNDNTISFFNGFKLLYSDTQYIQALRFDTTNQDPLTFAQVTGPDGLQYNDSIWENKFEPMAVHNTSIYDATITEFSQSSFTLNYSLISTYPDTTNGHQGAPRLMPIIRPDTFRFKITYNNF